MSNNDLPEDFHLWPSDPYHLLGVDRDSSPKEIKLAYTRLIKRFKPEHFPEQFRILREAFDKVNKKLLSWEWESLPKSPPPQSDSVPGRSRSISPTEKEARQLKNRPEALEQNIDDDPTTVIWNLARDQGLETALQAIRGSSWPAHLDSKMRMVEYWLIKSISPEPDSENAAKFLLKNLHYFIKSSRVMNIARQEIVSHPSLSNLIDLNKCFQASNSMYCLPQLLRIRWDAACHTQDYKLILSDFQLFSERYFDHHDTLDGVSITAINFLMWSTDEDIRKECDEILSNLEKDSGLRPSMNDNLAQIDLLKRIVKELEKVSLQMPNWRRLFNLVPAMWNANEAYYAASTSEWLVEASKDVTLCLTVFDELTKNSPSLLAFLKGALTRVLGAYSSNNADEQWEQFNKQDLKSDNLDAGTPTSMAIRQLLTTIDYRFYKKSRESILRFCLDNQITIQAFAKHITFSKSKLAIVFRGAYLDSLKADTSLAVSHELLTRLELASC